MSLVKYQPGQATSFKFIVAKIIKFSKSPQRECDKPFNFFNLSLKHDVKFQLICQNLVLAQAWNFILWKGEACYILQRGLPLRNLKVNGKVVKGAPRPIPGATRSWPLWPPRNSRHIGCLQMKKNYYNKPKNKLEKFRQTKSKLHMQTKMNAIVDNRKSWFEWLWEIFVNLNVCE